MKPILKILLVLVLAGGAFWLWRVFFPPDEVRIRRVLQEVAEAANVKAGEGNIALIRRVERLSSRLTPDVTLSVTGYGAGRVEISGRDEIQRGAAALTQGGRSLTVEFIDIQVAPVPSGADTADAVLTVKVATSGQREPALQALRVRLAKEPDFGWRIQRLETFSPLSQE